MATGYQLTPEELKAVAENGSARDKAAAASGQFAQTFNQSIANQGVRAGATQVKNAPPLPQGPPKASAAPVAGKDSIFTGLCDALNKHQQDLVKQKKREIPDQYVIEFAPAYMGASTIKRPGAQDATTAPMQSNATPEKLDPAKTKLNKDVQTWPIEAGTQILKVIDSVMRNSSFITEQQNVEITTATDPVTGLQTEKVNAKAGTGDMKWYKISMAATQLGFDNIIRDHAFRMTFIITPYAVAQMISQYFPDSKYKGVHKAYQYWFTGGNTQILSYEQKYDNAFHLMLTGIGQDMQKNITTDFRDQNRYVYMATSRDQAVGAKNYANEPANNGASFLYDPTSLSTVRMRIVGDPAWMQQGEAGLGVNSKTFDFSPFNADGGINFESRAVMFSVAFNAPSDYDFNTGIVNVNSNTRNGQPQEYYTYQAITVKNFFSKGRFEQELVGKLIIEKKILTPAAANGRPATAGGVPTATGSRERTTAQDEAQDLENGKNAGTGTSSTLPDDGSHGYAIQDETGQVSNIRKNEYGDLYYPAEPQPAAPPKPATSSGDVAPSTTSAPGNASDLQQFSFGALANNISTGFTNFNNNLNARLTGLNKPPQKIQKDDA